MIRSFGDRRTQTLFGRRDTGAFGDASRPALRKLVLLNGAADLGDLRSPPGNRLERLRGALDGFWSIRVNDQWRVVFRWNDGHAEDVRVMDYHRG